MNPHSMKSLKEFLAAEWGLSTEDISDEEALHYRWRRWGAVLVGSLIVLLAYVWSRTVLGRVYGDGLFLLAVIVVSVLSILRLRRVLTPGRLKGYKERAAKQVGLRIEDITDDLALRYDRENWKAILSQVSVVFAAYLLGGILWRNLVIDVLALLAVLSLGVLAVLGLWHPAPKTGGRTTRG